MCEVIRNAGTVDYDLIEGEECKLTLDLCQINIFCALERTGVFLSQNVISVKR